MEEPVRRSRFIILTTVVILATVVGLFFIWRAKEVSMWIFCLLIAVILVPALWLMPLKVGVSDSQFYIRRLLKSTVIPLDRIKSVRVFVPSPADGRICGLSGPFSRMGWYKSWEIGLYFAYIGDSDECMLIELKPDERNKERKYVVSCRNHVAMVEALNERLAKR